MDRLAEHGAGRSLDLPQGIRYETRTDTVMLTATEMDDSPYPALLKSATIQVPGSFTFVGGGGIELMRVDPPRDFTESSTTVQYADADAIGGRVTLRNRIEGDRFQPLGMESEKRLKDLFANAGIPKSWRYRVPILENERGIIWVGGLRIAEWASVTPDTQRVLRISLTS